MSSAPSARATCSGGCSVASGEHAAVAASRGSWGVGRFFFRVRVENGRLFELYYDRAPKDSGDRKGAWFLRCELSDDPRTAPP